MLRGIVILSEVKERPKPNWLNPIHVTAFGFGAGAMPKAPGTWGTLVAIPIYAEMVGLALLPYITVTVLLFLLGIWLCHVTSRDLNVHDHPGIVWDEIVGYLITMIAAPEGWIWWVIGFVLFRFFDIIKPWPIKRLDSQVRGGVGIMLDDVVAGVQEYVSVVFGHN